MASDGTVSYKEVLDSLYDPVYFVNKDMVITYWNRSAERFTGFAAEEVVGLRCSDNILVHVDDAGNHLCGGPCPLAKTIADGQPREADVFLHHKNGHRIPVSVRVAPIRGGNHNVIGAVEVFTDRSSSLTDLKKAEDLERLALLCPLTGIGNRRFTEMALRSALDEYNRYGWVFGVMFVDIDRFKGVNDQYGHAVGDRVLQMVAKTVGGGLRSFDFLGRWGGEEFLIVTPNVSREGLCAIANRLCMLVENSFVEVGFERMTITISVGGAIVKPEDTIETLVDRADRLMYESKKAGRNRATVEGA